MTITFTGYTINDADLTLRFSILDPGAGQANDCTVVMTDAELSSISNATQFRNAVSTKLQRKLQFLTGAGMAAKLNGFIGQSVTF